MAFNTALSGIQAASSALNVTGNNIANTSTTGFKASTTEFADVYASSVLGGGSNSVGSGVTLADVEQDFSQGNITFTNNALDMAINGNGFFIVSDQGETLYTRAGLFGVDADGFVVNNTGANLQGFAASSTGTISGQLGNLQVTTDNLPPIQTTGVSALLNLDARETQPLVPVFDAADQDSYNHATSLTVFDSQGNSHIMSAYFVKEAPVNEWTMILEIDGQNVGQPVPSVASYTLTFNPDGSLNSTVPDPILVDGWEPLDANGVRNGAAGSAAGALPTDPPTTSNFVFDLMGTTQFGSDFAVNDINQNGFATGLLAGVDISSEGFLFARYTNGQTRVLGQVGLANFRNVEALSPQGDTGWAETFDSGNPIVGTPGTSSLGVVQSGALEDSNVDLSEELVDLIISQRNYQANARSIETESAVTQALLQIR